MPWPEIWNFLRAIAPGFIFVGILTALILVAFIGWCDRGKHVD